MDNFYFKDYESLMTEWNRLNKLINTDTYRLGGTTPAVRLKQYKDMYTKIDGSSVYKKHNNQVVLWDTRTNQPFDKAEASKFARNEYNTSRYNTETPNKDFKYVDTLKKYFELEQYKNSEGFKKRDKLNIFGQRKVTTEGETWLGVKIDNKLDSLKKDSQPLFENSSYFDKNIDAILNKSTENSVSLKDASVNNRTKLLTNTNIALDTSKNSNLMRELAINPIDA